MKTMLAIILAALLSGFMTAESAAQTPDPGQACGNDVYALCGQAIPDQDRITACLRAHWDRVSKPCRVFMRNYAQHHHRGQRYHDFENYGSSGGGNDQ
jgi:hypothetical protein